MDFYRKNHHSKDAKRYQFLRNADLDAIEKGGIFAGKMPDKIVMNGIAMLCAATGSNRLSF